MKNQMLVESLKSECVKCGEDRLTLIEFHHVIPSEKEFEVTQYMSQGYSSIWKEAAKCVCVKIAMINFIDCLVNVLRIRQLL